MNKYNKQKIGDSGVDCLSACISQSDYLHPYFNKHDTIPLWDGSIHVYNDVKNNTDIHSGKIQVQIKTTTKKNINLEFQTKSIKRKHLEVYHDNGGIIYFLICINNNTYEIYYSALTQIKIKDLLYKNNKDRISTKLSLFPKNDIFLFTNKLREFLNETKCSTSSKLLSIADFKELRQAGFDSLSIPISYIGYDNPIDRLLDYSVYVHAKNRSAGLEIALRETDIKGIIFPDNNFNVSIDGKVYYFTFIKEKDKVIYLFNDNLQITFTRIENIEIQINITFNFLGTLSERIANIAFITSFMKSSKFSIGDEERHFPVSVDSWNGDNPDLKIELLDNHLQFYIDVKDTLAILKINKELDFSLLDKSGKNNLKFLINGLKYKRSQSINDHNEPNIIKNLKIANLWIRVLLEKQNDNSYIIENYFDTNLIGFFPSENTEDIGMPVSPYIFMQKIDFIKISNIDYNNIYNSFINIPDSDESFQSTVCLILEMLLAYDELNESEKCNELLECSLKITNWLLSKDAYDKSILLINKLQIIRRTRELTEEEKAFLFEIISKDKNNNILAGTYILLGNSIMAKKYYNLLSQTDKEEFDGLPINFFRKFDII